MRIELAKRLHKVITIAREMIDDQTASIAPELFGYLQQIEPNSGVEIPLIKAGTRINWNGTLKRAAVDLWDTTENNPDNAPTLWEDILYHHGYRIIPEVITAGTAFAKDEYGWWNNQLYKSLLNANVYTPEQYSIGWEAVQNQTFLEI